MPTTVATSTLVELLRYRSQHQPHQVAYTFLKGFGKDEAEADCITYQQLDQQAQSIAVQLQALHLGDRAMLVYSHDAGLDFIAAFLGCLYAGVIAIPSHLPRQRSAVLDLQARLASSQARGVLTQKSLMAKLKSQLAGGADAPDLWLATDSLPVAQTAWTEPPLNADTLAFLQYTSGSTGTPKGVMVTHGCILHNEQMLEVAFGHSEKTIVVGWLPLFHDMGLIGNVLQPMYLGVPAILMSPIAFVQKPIRWLQAISRYSATTSGAPNFAYDLLCHQVTAEQKQSLDLSSWDVAFSGAEPIRAKTLDQFAAAFRSCGFRRESFYPCYGMAEATLFISGGKKAEPPIIKCLEEAALEEKRVIIAADDLPGDLRSVADSRRMRSFVGCGRAWLDQKIVIVDPQTLTECAADRIGEVWVSSPSVGKGYWQQPEASADVFGAGLQGENCFLRTGDLGFLLEDELFITGRLKDVMVFWGYNHYPQHIEQTVEQCHPVLRRNAGAAFAVAIDGEERLVIAGEVERSYRHRLNVNEVAEAIRWAVFQEHLVDVYAIVLLKPGSIPKTSSNKIQRRACRAKFLEGSLESMGEWRSAEKRSDITALIQRYLRPRTHLNRYFLLAKGKFRRFLYLSLGI